MVRPLSGNAPSVLGRRRALGIAALVSAGCVFVVAPWAAGFGSVVIRDRVGDVKSPDLDLVHVTIIRSRASITATFVVAGPIRDDVSYAVFLTGEKRQLIGVWAERSHGRASFYALDPATFRSFDVRGSLAGRISTVSAPLAALRLSRTELVHASVMSGGLHKRKAESDHAALFPVAVPPSR